MASISTILTAMLVINNGASVDSATEASARSVAQEARMLVAQAQSQAQHAQSQAQQAQSKAQQAQSARSARDSARAPTEEEALALTAMEGLMAQPPERALPIIKRVLSGSQTTLVKRRALFVLSQIDSPESQEILLQMTRSQDEALRREAIRSIGISGNSKSLSALQEIYKSANEDAKRDVLQAWLIAGRKDEVYQAALNAQSEAEANSAIRTLAAMGAVEELRKLGDRPNAGSGLIDAYAIGGDLTSLRKIVDGAAEISVRSEAVRKIGIIGNEAARDALRDIYANSSNEQIKDAALQGMLIGGDEQGLLTLFRAAKSPEEKRALLRTLSRMDSEAALQAIDAALEGNQ